MNVSNFSLLPSPGNQCMTKSKINDDQIDVNPSSSQSPVPESLYEGTCQTVPDYSMITKVECASPENFHVKNENSNDIRSTDWVDDANSSGKSVESVKKTHETRSNEASLANHSGVFWHTKSVANASTMTDWDTPENLSKTDIKDDGVLTSFDDNIRRQILFHEDLSNCTTIHLQRQENAMAKYLARLQPMSLPLGIQQFLDQHNVKPLKIDFKRNENDCKPRTKDIKSTTNLDGLTVYYCPECFIETADRDHLETHLAAHKSERRFVCNVCGACLKRKEHLDQHKRRHSEERPFVCNVCCKGFKRNEHLRRHYVIHSGNKMYTCPECGKAFSRKDHLNKHSQTHNLVKTNNT